MKHRVAVVAFALCALAPVAREAGPRDPLYRFTDAEGVVRYTSELQRIPQAVREEAIRVEPPRRPAEPLPAFDGAPPSEPETAPGREDSAAALPAVEAPGVGAEPDAAVVPSPLEIRIAELEREIADDEATLADFISDPARASQLRVSDEVAAIAERLPRLQDELRTLRALQEPAATRDD